MKRPSMTTIAFAWLTFSGAMHFVADVALQLARHARLPSPETTLYYGANSAYALGQVLFGICGWWIASKTPEASKRILLLALIAAACWFAIAHLTMEYWQPKAAVGIFAGLAIAALASRGSFQAR